MILITRRHLSPAIIDRAISLVSALILALPLVWDFPADARVADQTLDIPDQVTTLPLGLPPFKQEREDSAANIEFGEFLFRSQLLSRSQTLSCESCHSPSLGLSGDQTVAIGAQASSLQRRPPPLINLYNTPELMWDGRARGLLNQVHIPIETATEMNIDWPAALTDLSKTQEAKSFHAKSPNAKINREAVLAALAAYVHSLVSGQSAFDRYYFGHDEEAINQDAKDGLRVFVRKARCSTCHLMTGEAAPFTDNNFHSIGIGWTNGAYTDEGRYAVTGSNQDRGRFKTPTLRNVALRHSFMHDGSMISLRQVIEYYNKGEVKDAANIDKRLGPLFLTEDDINDLIQFLNTLSGRIESYRPPLPR